MGRRNNISSFMLARPGTNVAKRLIQLGGSTALELWHSGYGISSTSGLVNTWTGQKAGTVLSPLGASNPALITSGGSSSIRITTSANSLVANLPGTFYPATTTPFCIFTRTSSPTINTDYLFAICTTGASGEKTHLCSYGEGGGNLRLWVKGSAVTSSAFWETRATRSMWFWSTGSALNWKINNSSKETWTVNTDAAALMDRLLVGMTSYTQTGLSTNTYVSLVYIFTTYPGDTVAAQIQSLAESDLP
jgi:hypothetical protein